MALIVQNYGGASVGNTERNKNGITWTNASTGSSLANTFQRDALSRITNILDAAGNALTYRYDANSHPAFNLHARHELPTLMDARGLQAVRNEFDEAGRLISNAASVRSWTVESRDAHRQSSWLHRGRVADAS